MPNKDFINIFILSFISTCYTAASSAFPALDRVGESSRSHSACAEWAFEPETLGVGHICVATAAAGDERPRYVQTWEGKTYRFLFSASGLALVVESQVLVELRESAAAREKLMEALTEDRLAIWHNDALYWWRWLENSNTSWNGSEAS